MTSPPSQTVQTPPRDTRAPGKVGHLRAITKVPKQVTLEWADPRASDLAGVVVRRGPAGACPASRRDGIRIGGASVRRRQVDNHVAAGTRYCYAVFAFDSSGNYSHPTDTRVTTAAPVHPVTGLTAKAVAGHVQLSWHNPPPAGIKSVVVRRGISPSCPAGPADGTAVGGRSVRSSQVDTTVKGGVSYCYRVFALNAAGHAAPSNPNAEATAPIPPPAHPKIQAAGVPSSSSGWLTSTLLRSVVLIGLLMLVVTAGATVVTRRRTHISAYVPAREGGPRLALTGVAPVALVIPALIVLGGCGVILFVLLNL